LNIQLTRHSRIKIVVEESGITMVEVDRLMADESGGWLMVLGCEGELEGR
jgi:hypothetical protein